MFMKRKDKKVAIEEIKKEVADFIQYFDNLKKKNPHNSDLYDEFVIDQLSYLTEPCMNSSKSQGELKKLISEWIKSGIDIPDNKAIIFAVRDKPVINDALVEDAKECGLDKRAKIMSSGVDAPGTVLKYCSKEFMDVYKNADLVISKGQGNYEALSQERENIYFLFRAKCPVIARYFCTSKNLEE